MAAGITRQAKRGKNRRWLYKMEDTCRRLFPDAAVQRHGERCVTIYKPKDMETRHYAQCITVRLSWGGMSNGESFALALIDEKFPGWGDFEKHLQTAYAKV